MNPLGSRARADELAALLEGAVAGPGTVTAPYATLATRLRALGPALEAQLTPRPEFRAALRQRLVAVATVQAAAGAGFAEPISRPKALEAAVTWTSSRRAQRRIGALAGGMAAIVAMTGVAVASSRSLPGQPFYGLKRAGEGVQLDFTSGDTAKGSKHLEFAATRLREVKALAHGEGSLSLGNGTHPVADGLAFGGSVSKRIADTLTDFNSETNAGTALLTKVYRKTGKPAPLRIITSFTTAQRSQLSDLLPSLPSAVQPQAQRALTLVTQAGSDATDLLALGTCGGSCYPGNAGPTLPTSPVPTPGATASPSDGSTPVDSNGVPSCTCGTAPSGGPDPQQQPTPSTAPTPTTRPNQPSDQPTPTPAPTPTPRPSGPVIVIPPIPGVTLPPILPTAIPLPPLPIPLPSLPSLPLLPTLLPPLFGGNPKG